MPETQEYWGIEILATGTVRSQANAASNRSRRAVRLRPTLHKGEVLRRERVFPPCEHASANEGAAFVLCDARLLSLATREPSAWYDNYGRFVQTAATIAMLVAMLSTHWLPGCIAPVRPRA